MYSHLESSSVVEPEEAVETKRKEVGLKFGADDWADCSKMNFERVIALILACLDWITDCSAFYYYFLKKRRVQFQNEVTLFGKETQVLLGGFAE